MKLLVHIFFESKQFWIQTKLGHKNFIMMKLLVKNNSESKAIVGSKKIWVLKKVGPTKFWVHNNFGGRV